jgi:Uma2 family endonuclease
VDIGPNTLRYPDIVVDPAGEASRDLVATAPQLIAEVLSPSTERIDLGDKAAEYLGLSSFSAYLVFAQDELKAWAWARGPNGFPSGPQVHSALDAVIRIVAPAKQRRSTQLA